MILYTTAFAINAIILKNVWEKQTSDMGEGGGSYSALDVGFGDDDNGEIRSSRSRGDNQRRL